MRKTLEGGKMSLTRESEKTQFLPNPPRGKIEDYNGRVHEVRNL